MKTVEEIIKESGDQLKDRVQDWYSLIGVVTKITIGQNRNGILTGQE